MGNPLAGGWGGALVPHTRLVRQESDPAGLGLTGTAVGGQGLPLLLPDSREPGESREGFLFGNPPCMIFTVAVSRDFS